MGRFSDFEEMKLRQEGFVFCGYKIFISWFRIRRVSAGKQERIYKYIMIVTLNLNNI